MLAPKVFRFFISILYFFIGHAVKSFIYGFRSGDEEEGLKRDDVFVETILENITRDSENDYCTVEDYFVCFPRNEFFKIQGEIGFYNTHIRGLRTLKRNYICSPTTANEIQKHIIANLGAKSICFHSELQVKVSDFKRAIVLQGTLKNIKISWDFSMNSETGRYLIVHGLYIHEIEGMELSISGLGSLTYPINVLINLTIRFMKCFARNLIEYMVENYLSEHLPKYQLPTEELYIARDLKSTRACNPVVSKPKKVTFAEEMDSTRAVTGELTITSMFFNTLDQPSISKCSNAKITTKSIKFKEMVEVDCLTTKTLESPKLPSEMQPEITNNINNNRQMTEEIFPEYFQDDSEIELNTQSFGSESLKRKHSQEGLEDTCFLFPLKCAKYKDNQYSITEQIKNGQSEKINLEGKSQSNEISDDLTPEKKDISKTECNNFVHESKFEYIERFQTNNLKIENEIDADRQNSSNEIVTADAKKYLMLGGIDYSSDASNKKENLIDRGVVSASEDAPDENAGASDGVEALIENVGTRDSEEAPVENVNLLGSEEAAIENVGLIGSEEAPNENVGLLDSEEAPIENVGTLYSKEIPIENASRLDSEEILIENVGTPNSEEAHIENIAEEDNPVSVGASDGEDTPVSVGASDGEATPVSVGASDGEDTSVKNDEGLGRKDFTVQNIDVLNGEEASIVNVASSNGVALIKNADVCDSEKPLIVNVDASVKDVKESPSMNCHRKSSELDSRSECQTIRGGSGKRRNRGKKNRSSKN